MSSPHPPKPIQQLSEERTTRLLELACADEGSPDEGLLDRLESAEGTLWLKQALADLPVPRVTATIAFQEGRLSEKELATLKERCKVLHATSRDEDRLVAELGYYLCLAAALIHYDVRIGSQSPERMRETFLDLASVVPDPWGPWLEQAARLASGPT